jgi:hypothetical protein
LAVRALISSRRIGTYFYILSYGWVEAEQPELNFSTDDGVLPFSTMSNTAQRPKFVCSRNEKGGV